MIMTVLSISACSGGGSGAGPTGPSHSLDGGLVSRIEITPRSGEARVGGTLVFTATVFDRDGNVLGSGVTWSVMDSAVADISPSGVAQGKAVGLSAIRASAGNVSATALFRVNSPQDKEKAGEPGF